jgi:hypothetical protein
LVVILTRSLQVVPGHRRVQPGDLMWIVASRRH